MIHHFYPLPPPPACREYKRLALFPLTDEEVGALVRWWLSGEKGALPLAPRLPEGAEVVGFGFSEAYRTFAVKLRHPDWEVVWEGDMVPLLDRD